LLDCLLLFQNFLDPFLLRSSVWWL